MTTDRQIELMEIMASRTGTVDPSRFPDEVFDLYSIPAFDKGLPDVVAGCQIGSAKPMIQPGDVLLSRIVPHIRRAWIVREDRGRRLLASSEWIVFRSDRFHPSYLRHFLTSDVFHSQFMTTVAGVGGSLLRARTASVARLRISLPPLEKQRRIAEILDQADAIRRKRREVQPDVQGLWRSGFAQICGHPGASLDRWPVMELGSLLSFVTSGSRGWAEYYVTEGKRFIRSLDVQMNRIEAIDPAYVRPPDTQEARRTMVQGGDVLLTITGSRVGRVAPVPDDFEEAYVSQHVAILRPNERVQPEYLSMFLSLPDGGQRIISRTRYGQTKPGLSLEQIKRYPIPLPTLDVQNRFHDWWQQTERLHEHSAAATADAEELFAALADRAFRGEL